MNWSPARIFLVDDGPLADLGAALRHGGYQVVVVPDFAPFTAEIGQLGPTLIYFDLDRTSPPPALLAVQRARRLPVMLMPVRLMTARAGAAAQEARSESDRYDGFLEWPVPAAELRWQIADHLRKLELVSVGVALSEALHELRTPLGSIKGYLSTLNTFGEQVSEQHRRETTRFAEEEVDRLTAMLAELTALERDLRMGDWQNHRGDTATDRTRR